MEKILISNGKALVDDTGKVLTFESDVTITRDDKSIGLSGDYDGSPIEITEAGKFDIKTLIDEKKIPLEVNVNVASSGGVVVVDELPTESIQEGVIYQVNEVSEIDVYIKLEENDPPVNLYTCVENLIGEGGSLSGLLLEYYLVDSLPSTPEVSDLQTFARLYCYIYNDTPFFYGDVGYGDMWLEASQIISVVTGIELENKGYIRNIGESSVTGVFVTYKLGSLGVAIKEKYKSYIAEENNWVEPETILFKTMTEYSSHNLRYVPEYMFAYQQNLRKVDLPNVEIIEHKAFEECDKLESSQSKPICFPNVKIIKSEAFYNVKKMLSIKLPKVTCLYGDSFRGCNINVLYLGGQEVVEISEIGEKFDPFANGSCSDIYVRPELLSAYQNDTKWKKVINEHDITLVGDYTD